jgi:serine/threonine protein phosphatase 1
MVLRGNHEEMMVKALKGDLTVYRHWLTFGGRETLTSWGVDREIAEGPATMDNLASAAATVGPEPVAWLEKLPLQYRHGDYLFVHAGVRPGVSLKRQHPDDLLWIKNNFLESEVSQGLTIVHGHSISEQPVFRSNRIGIDTGAYRSGRLTALAIEGDERWILDTTEATRSDGGDTLELSERMRLASTSAQARTYRGTGA